MLWNHADILKTQQMQKQIQKIELVNALISAQRYNFKSKNCGLKALLFSVTISVRVAEK